MERKEKLDGNEPKCFGSDADDTVTLPCENCPYLYLCSDEAERLGKNAS